MISLKYLFVKRKRNRKCKYTLRMTKLHSGKVAAEDDFVEENEEPLADDPVLEE